MSAPTPEQRADQLRHTVIVQIGRLVRGTVENGPLSGLKLWSEIYDEVIAPLLAETERRGAEKALDQLQSEVAEWHSRELSPDPDPMRVAAKVCEEAGEHVGAAIKASEVRNDGIDWLPEVRKELGDVVISACVAAWCRGWSLSDVVRDRWAIVSQRRFATRVDEITRGEQP